MSTTCYYKPFPYDLCKFLLEYKAPCTLGTRIFPPPQDKAYNNIEMKHLTVIEVWTAIGYYVEGYTVGNRKQFFLDGDVVSITCEFYDNYKDSSLIRLLG